jgi:hypothetical protein
MPLGTLPVKHFNSEQPGAPVLSGTAGSLIALLDACLLNGFNVLTPQSASASGGVVTLTYASAHGHGVDQILKIAGSAGGVIDGEARITSVTSTTLSFAAPGVPDGPIAGSITTRMAPAGWEKPFSGTNKAAYRSVAPDSTRFFLRVDDSGSFNVSGQNQSWTNQPRIAAVFGAESMTDIDTWSGQFPNASQSGKFWTKSTANDGTARRWRLFADDRFLMFFCYKRTDIGYASGFRFGDIVPFRPGDAYHAVINGGWDHATFFVNSTFGSEQYESRFPYLSGDTTGAFLCRASSQIGDPVASAAFGSRLQDQSGVGGLTFPNPADNGLLLHAPILVSEPGGSARGTWPGLYQPLHGDPFTTETKVSNVPGLPGRTLQAVWLSRNSSSFNRATVFIDITGPWR